MNLKNAKVLVTGGSKGIGKATAKMLAEAGAKVVITARHEQPLNEAAKEIGAYPIVMDMAIQEDIDRSFDEAVSHLGGLDILINNAGIGGRANLQELKREDFDRVHTVNVVGAAMMAKRAAILFMEQNYGNIVNIASTAATKGYEGGTIYSSSKWALKGMTECWRAELRKYNVRVFLINPSEVTTAFGSSSGQEREPQPNKLRGEEIASAIRSVLEMDDRGFVPELSVWATNPW
ncbi:MAG: SDR family oxidoreductase [Bacteroidia bacterium]